MYSNGELTTWNKGLTKGTDERVKKSAKNYPQKRKSPTYSQEELKRRQNSFRGKNNPNFNPDKSEFTKYKLQCRFNFNPGLFPDEFDITKIRNMFHPTKNKTGYTMDHMLSIYDGFTNNIDSNILKHPANCNILLHRENSRKNKNSSITLKQLNKKIITWGKNYGEYN